MKKIILISNALAAPFDEGKKNIALYLHKQLEAKKNVLSVSVTNEGNDTGELNITKIGLNRFFFNNKLRLLIKEQCPDIIIYIPDNSCTFNSFIRAKMIKLMDARLTVVMVGAQHREYNFIQDLIIRKILRPDQLFLLGRADKEFFAKRGIKTRVLPPAVDNVKFSPPTKEEKSLIRSEYNIPENKTVILHVGHINANRNIESLLEIQKVENMQVVIVGSTTTEVEQKLKSKLLKGGVILINDFMSDISGIYKMSDAYIFPVINNNAAIEMPLSVLEAMACNLPVITTRFGGLMDYFSEGRGFRYYSSAAEMIQIIKDFDGSEVDNYQKIERFTWDSFIEEILTVCEESA